ncbi:MAG TPA: hypothetical protein VK993_15705, partial [Chthoniobacterales bacterium]|nr:hypothetical protein [Chthoniobacterales bacterium]
DAKVRLQQQVVAMLRAGGKDDTSLTWDRIESDERLWSELGSYDLRTKERRSHLNKVAFPDANASAVDAALGAGNNLNALYDLARGRASVDRDAAGQFLSGKKGLKINRSR